MMGVFSDLDQEERLLGHRDPLLVALKKVVGY